MRYWSSSLAVIAALLITPAYAQSRVDQLSAGAAVSSTDNVANCQGCNSSTPLVKTPMSAILTFIQSNISLAFSAITGSPSAAQLETNFLAAMANQLTPTLNNCAVGNGSAWTSAACPGGGGSSTGVGVDGGTSQQAVTGGGTINNSARTVSVGAGWVTGTLTLPAISAVSSDTEIAINDQGGNVTGSATLTVQPNAADGINNGSHGTADTTFTQMSTICYRVTATHNWTRSCSGIIQPQIVVSHQWVQALENNGQQPQSQPAFTDISGSASVGQIGASAASHAVPVDVGGTSTYKIVPDCQDTGGNHLNYTQSTDAYSCGNSSSGGGGTIIANSIGGLVASNDSSTPNSVLDIASGTAADTTNAVIISPGAFTKSTAGFWVSGSGSNGMGNGLTVAASTLYAVCLANNGGTPDYWFDTSFSCSHRPSGITDTKFRRVASFVTDSSSHILPFFQRNDTIIFKGQYTAAGSPLTFSATPATLTLPVPPFSVATITLYNGNASTAVAMIVYDTDASSTTGSNGNVQCLLETSVSASNSNVCTISVVTDANSTITLVSSGGSTGANIYVNTASFRDMRGQ